MAIRLNVRGPANDQATELSFDQERVRIGRGGMCDVRLPAPSVSAEHAMVFLDGDRYFVVDVGSRNGTTVNGEPLVIERRKLLRHCDVIGVCGFELEFQAGVGMASAHSDDRTAAAARHLARQVMSGGGLDLEQPSLVVLSGPQQGQRCILPAPPSSMTIGRSEDCEFVLVDGDVSRRHVKIDIAAEGVTAEELGAKNPLFVNDREIQRCRLHDRDELLVGSTVLVFDEPVEAFLRELAERPESLTEQAGPPTEPGSTKPGPTEPVPGEDEPKKDADPPPEGEQEHHEVVQAETETDADHEDQIGTGSGEPIHPEPAPPTEPQKPGSFGSAGTELAVLFVGALALAACVAALVWLFR